MNTAFAALDRAVLSHVSFPELCTMTFEYPSKIILAWGEAISGNREIRDWLINNGYPELGLFSYALRNKEDARDWLMKNGYPHLLALINGAEGNSGAILWLKKNGWDVLEKMAMSGDNNDVALAWLIQNNFNDMAVIATKIRFVKNEIEQNNNDVHKISPD